MSRLVALLVLVGAFAPAAVMGALPLLLLSGRLADRDARRDVRLARAPREPAAVAGDPDRV